MINENIKRIEDYYLIVFDSMFKELNIVDIIRKDYLHFLSGEKNFSVILQSIKELNDLYFDQIIEYVELLKGLYWIKEM